MHAIPFSVPKFITSKKIPFDITPPLMELHNKLGSTSHQCTFEGSRRSGLTLQKATSYILNYSSKNCRLPSESEIDSP